METTAVRKLLIDSRFRNADSVSSTDFQFELNRSITLPRKCVAFVTDIHLPHSWYNVDDHAHRLFWMERFFDAQHTTLPALRVHKAELTQQHSPYLGMHLRPPRKLKERGCRRYPFKKVHTDRIYIESWTAVGGFKCNLLKVCDDLSG